MVAALLKELSADSVPIKGAGVKGEADSGGFLAGLVARLGDAQEEAVEEGRPWLVSLGAEEKPGGFLVSVLGARSLSVHSTLAKLIDQKETHTQFAQLSSKQQFEKLIALAEAKGVRITAIRFHVESPEGAPARVPFQARAVPAEAILVAANRAESATPSALVAILTPPKKPVSHVLAHNNEEPKEVPKIPQIIPTKAKQSVKQPRSLLQDALQNRPNTPDDHPKKPTRTHQTATILQGEKPDRALASREPTAAAVAQKSQKSPPDENRQPNPTQQNRQTPQAISHQEVRAQEAIAQPKGDVSQVPQRAQTAPSAPSEDAEQKRQSNAHVGEKVSIPVRPNQSAQAQSTAQNADLRPTLPDGQPDKKPQPAQAPKTQQPIAAEEVKDESKARVGPLAANTLLAPQDAKEKKTQARSDRGPQNPQSAERTAKAETPKTDRPTSSSTHPINAPKIVRENNPISVPPKDAAGGKKTAAQGDKGTQNTPTPKSTTRHTNTVPQRHTAAQKPTVSEAKAAPQAHTATQNNPPPETDTQEPSRAAQPRSHTQTLLQTRQEIAPEQTAPPNTPQAQPKGELDKGLRVRQESSILQRIITQKQPQPSTAQPNNASLSSRRDDHLTQRVQSAMPEPIRDGINGQQSIIRAVALPVLPNQGAMIPEPVATTQSNSTTNSGSGSGNHSSQSESGSGRSEMAGALMASLEGRVRMARSTISHFASALKESIENYKPPLMRLAITLNPKELGEIEVVLKSRGKNLQVSMQSNPQAVALLYQNSAEFRQNLQQLGFGDVGLSFEDGGQGGQRQGESPYAHQSATADENDEGMEIADLPTKAVATMQLYG